MQRERRLQSEAPLALQGVCGSRRRFPPRHPGRSMPARRQTI